LTALAVLSVASEVFPLVKTGGLADVAGALPVALAAEDVVVRTLVPGYPPVLAALRDGEAVLEFSDLLGFPARIIAGEAAGLDILALDVPELYARAGNPYLDPTGNDWPDNPLRFAALARAAAEIGLSAWRGFVPDIVHAHDWQAGLAPVYLHYAGEARPGTVMTVHNLAFQGHAAPELLGRLALPPAAMAIEAVEYFGSIGFLKGGLALADRITTVSPTYAAEIQTPDGGMGLGGLLHARAASLSGIINGIDTTVWDPARDKLLAAPFFAARVGGRAANKQALQERLGLAPDPAGLLFGVVSRLSWQKGLDLLLETLPVLLASGAQLALLGSGDRVLEDGFRAAALAFPGRVACRVGYDERLAHLVQGGSDALLVPSRFEPCGLTQLCALRYGSVPVVARVGGLADTVIDANEMAIAAGVGTGLVFSPVTATALEAALRRAAELWRDQAAWRRVQANGMVTDVSWRRPARRYAQLYRELVAERASA